MCTRIGTGPGPGARGGRRWTSNAAANSVLGVLEHAQHLVGGGLAIIPPWFTNDSLSSAR